MQGRTVFCYAVPVSGKYLAAFVVKMSVLVLSNKALHQSDECAAVCLNLCYTSSVSSCKSPNKHMHNRIKMCRGDDNL